MHHPTDRIAHTTAFVTPVVEHWQEWEIAEVRSNDLSHNEQTFLQVATSCSFSEILMPNTR